MNKQLFEKVKSLSKDTGLSEKYLIAITEKLGGSIEDDSTDEAEIDKIANLIADLAKESQGEATRWASKNKPKKKTSKSDDSDDDDSDDDDSDDQKGKKGNKGKDQNDDRIKALEDKLAEYEAKEKKASRAKDIATAMEKHKIPAFLRGNLSIPDDADIEKTVSELKQGFITNGLMTDEQEGVKVASEKQVDEAADSLLESITAK